MPKYLWGDAVLTASYLINRMPTRVLQYTTPLSCFKKIFPSSRVYSKLPLKKFGCTAYVHIPKRSRSKLEPRAEKCVFLGYPPNKKGYKCFNPLTKKNYISMDVSFLETTPYFQKNLIQGENLEESNFWDIVPLPNTILDASPSLKDVQTTETESEIGLSDKEILRLVKNRQNLEPVVYSRKNVIERNKDQQLVSEPDQSEALSDGHLNTPGNNSHSIYPLPPSVTNPESEPSVAIAPRNINSDLHLPVAIRKGTRACTKYPIAKYISYNQLSETHRAFTTNISDIVVPRNIQEALEKSAWKLAVFEEMNALKRTDTW